MAAEERRRVAAKKPPTRPRRVAIVRGGDGQASASFTVTFLRGGAHPLLRASWFKVAPALFEDSAPFAPMASLEARSGPQQPQAAAQQLGRQRSLMEGDERRPSK